MDLKTRLDLATVSLQMMNAVIEFDVYKKDAVSHEMFELAFFASKALVREDYAFAYGYVDELAVKATLAGETQIRLLAITVMNGLKSIIRDVKG